VRDDLEEPAVLQLIQLLAVPEVDALDELFGRRVLADERLEVDGLVVVRDRDGRLPQAWQTLEKSGGRFSKNACAPSCCSARQIIGDPPVVRPSCSAVTLSRMEGEINDANELVGRNGIEPPTPGIKQEINPEGLPRRPTN